MNVDIDITEYLSEEEIREIVESEIRVYVRGKIRAYYDGTNAEIIARISSDFVLTVIGEEVEDLKPEIMEAARRATEALTENDVFGYSFDDRPNDARKVLNSCIEEVRPEIASRARELFLASVDAVDVAEVLSGVVYNIFRDALGASDERE